MAVITFTKDHKMDENDEVENELNFENLKKNELIISYMKRLFSKQNVIMVLVAGLAIHNYYLQTLLEDSIKVAEDTNRVASKTYSITIDTEHAASKAYEMSYQAERAARQAYEMAIEAERAASDAARFAADAAYN